MKNAFAPERTEEELNQTPLSNGETKRSVFNQLLSEYEATMPRLAELGAMSPVVEVMQPTIDHEEDVILSHQELIMKKMTSSRASSLNEIHAKLELWRADLFGNDTAPETHADRLIFSVLRDVKSMLDEGEAGNK